MVCKECGYDNHIIAGKCLRCGAVLKPDCTDCSRCGIHCPHRSENKSGKERGRAREKQPQAESD